MGPRPARARRLVVGIASFIGLTILGIYVDPIFGRFAVLLAIVAAIGELIPIIGPIISAVPAVLLGLTAGVGPALAALILYFVIQQVENNVLVPKIQSDAIDLHPSIVIAALVIGGAIFGLLGAILALPVTAAGRDVFKYAFQRAGDGGGRRPDRRAGLERRRDRGDGGGRGAVRGRDRGEGGPMTRASDPGFDPYKVLQLDPEADPEIIQVVYRRLARRYHPDVTPGLAAAAKMIELNAAMDILSDPTRRAAYDRERARRERTAARATTPSRIRTTRRRAGAPGASGSGSGTATTAAGGPGRRTGPDGSRRPDADPPDRRPSRVTGRAAGRPSARATTRAGCAPPRATGAAGPPPGDPSGSVLNFGRYAGWSLGEIARTDLEYIEWLDRMTIGRSYRPELDAILRGAGRRRGAPVEEDRRGLFRRS